jgi:hypothetical protein
VYSEESAGHMSLTLRQDQLRQRLLRFVNLIELVLLCGHKGVLNHVENVVEIVVGRFACSEPSLSTM